MVDQPLVPQDIYDMTDGKIDHPKPPVTGNQRIIEEMKKQAGGPNA